MCGDMLWTHQLWKRKNNSVRKMTSPAPDLAKCDVVTVCNLQCNQCMSQIVGNTNKQKKQTHHVIATMLAMYRVQAGEPAPPSHHFLHALLRHSHQTVEHCSLCHIAHSDVQKIRGAARHGQSDTTPASTSESKETTGLTH